MVIQEVVADFEVVIEEEDRLVLEQEVEVRRKPEKCTSRRLCAHPIFAGEKPQRTDWGLGRGGFQQQSYGPPDQVFGTFEFRSCDEFGTNFLPELGKFLHASEGELVCESVNPKIPYFNAPIYLENKVCHIANS